jgi:hypothetical protein
METKLFGLIVVLAAATTAALAQETDEARNARLAELNANNVFYSALASRTVTSAVPMTVLPQAITLSIGKPLFFSSGTTGRQIQWLADTNRSGSADLVGTFWEGKGNRVVAMTSFGGYLYAHDGQSSILRFTDSNSDGVADSEPVEVFAGAAYTERLMAYGVDRLYAQDNGRGRLLRYNVGTQSGTTMNQSLPQLGVSYIDGTVYSSELRSIFTIDQNNSTVNMFYANLDGSVSQQSNVVFSGQRIANIAVDGASGLLFVLQAGQCATAPQTPSVPGTDQATDSNSAPTICSSGSLSMVRLNNGIVGGSQQTTLAVGGWMFNIDYSSQPHSMIAFDGKVYVTVFSASPQSSGPRSQVIVSYETVGKALENQQGVLFADQAILGRGFITSLATFAGGPVTQQVVQQQ